MDIAEFGKLYEQYMEQKRNEMKKLYNRVLPSGELIFNRYEKAGYLDCGEGTSVYDTSVVMGDVKIGKNTWVGPYTLLEEAVSVGDVSIGNNTMIGSLSMVAYGVHIGDHCVIGAHSFVNKDIPNCKIAVGVPAEIIGDVILNEDGTVELKYYKNEDNDIRNETIF